MVRAALVVSVWFVLGTASAAEDPQLSANVRGGGVDTRQIDQAGSRIRRGHAEGLIDAPIDQVMGVIQDYGNYENFMPKFQKSRVLSRRGSDALLYVQVSALHGMTTLWAEVKVKAKDVSPPSRRIEARMLRGNLKQFEASWQATPVGEHKTLVAFELCADPDLPLAIADGLISDQNETEARRSIRALRTYMATHKPEAPSAR